jgi:hypothetical protein
MLLRPLPVPAGVTGVNEQRDFETLHSLCSGTLTTGAETHCLY